MTFLARRGKCNECGYDWDKPEGWHTAENIAGFAGTEIRELQKRIRQFQFCIDQVAHALGDVCCGGVDSSPEEQLRDPHSTTRVLCDAIYALKKDVEHAQSVVMDDDAVAAIEGLREVMPRPLTKAEESFKCKARLSGSDPMPDCDWPMCGCDPYANKVIATLEESGILFKGEL